MSNLAFPSRTKRVISILVIVLLPMTLTSPSVGVTRIQEYQKIEYLQGLLWGVSSIDEAFNDTLPVFLAIVRSRNPDITALQLDRIKLHRKNALESVKSGLEIAFKDAISGTFSDSEIDALFNFYHTEAGRSIADKQKNLRSLIKTNSAYWNSQYDIELKIQLETDDMLKGLIWN